MFAAGPSEEAAVGSGVPGSEGVGASAGADEVAAGVGTGVGVEVAGLVGSIGTESLWQPLTRKPRRMTSAAVKDRERKVLRGCGTVTPGNNGTSRSKPKTPE